jgi:hypothetical protein
MEGLTRLVAESLARHGFDRPVDYRRLNWSRWFRCESPHSLLFVPSKPGIFAIAEEIAALCGASEPRSRNPELSEGSPAFSSELSPEKRMLAVLQFGEAEDIAFVLDRTLTRQNPLRERMAAGRCFVRFVVIEDAIQRRSICAALNQWIASSTEKATGIGAHFASSLELTPITDRVGAGDSPAHANSASMLSHVPAFKANTLQTAPQPDTGAAANLHSPTPFPSGF